jgi:hypothetical protein
MRLSELGPQTIGKIKTFRWDRTIEKHEGLVRIETCQNSRRG